MTHLIFAICAFLLAKFCTCSLNSSLITDYFSVKSVTVGTIFTCQNKTGHIRLAKELFRNGLRINAFDVDRHEQLICEKMLFRYYYHVGVVLEGTCKGSEYIIQKCGNVKLFDEAHHWLIVLDNDQDIYKYFRNVTININADINTITPNYDTSGTLANWTILDVYNPASRHGGDLKTSAIGSYSKHVGYVAAKNGSRYWTRKNMTGVTFKSAVVIPIQSKGITLDEYLSSEKNREKNSMHRFQSTTVRYCRDLYNFSLSLQRTTSWGYIQGDGQFDGLVGLLKNKLVDFGSSPLILKYDRLPVVDYSFGNWILKSTFIFRPPHSTASSFEIFARPLARNVWWCVIGSAIIMTFAVKTILHAEQSMFRNLRQSVETTWSFAVVFIVGAFCQQGCVYSPMLTSGRIITMFIFVLAILIYQFYSGYIVSYLLMDPPREVNTLKDLLHSHLDVGIENILIDRDYFVQTKDPVALDLFGRKARKGPNQDGFYEPEEGLELVLKRSFAFHVETSTAYPIIRKTFPPRVGCELQEVQMYRTQPMYTNLQKHSPFKEMLNYCMLRLVDSGNMHRLRRYWDSHKPECIEADEIVTISVDLNEFSCALYILMFGILISIIILLIEIVATKPLFNNIKRIVKKRLIKA